MAGTFASLWNTVLVLIGFGLVVALHELGHLRGLKWSGAAVRQFGIGMGRKLWSCWLGSTEYSLHLLPIGGFVRTVGENADGSNMADIEADAAKAPTPEAREFLVDPANWITNKTPGQRLVYIAAGPAFSILGAMPILMLSLAFYGTDSPSKPARVEIVEKDSTAQTMGIAPGDLLVAVNGVPVADSIEAVNALGKSHGETLLSVRRGDEEIALNGTPATVSGRTRFGVGFGTDVVKLPAAEAVSLGAYKTFAIATGQFTAVYGLITGANSIRDFEGPVGIVSTLGQSASAGWGPFIQILCIFSIAIGAMNLLPVLPLDGGHIVVQLFELVRRRKMPNALLETYAYASIVAFGALIIAVLYSDIAKRFFA